MELDLPQLKPYNLSLLDPETFIKNKGCLPVTSPAIFESSSTRFHPDGLYSEVIFGQVGSTDRLIKFGYFDLRTTIISPHMYKQVLALKSAYKKIISGTAFGKINPETGDIDLTSDTDPEGHTGFSWFCSVLPTLRFPKSSSSKRDVKIGLVEKFRSQMLIDKFIILPAGVRDIKLTDKGKVSPEEINKLYVNMLSAISALPEKDNDDPVFDIIRLQIQNKALEIYEYISNLVEGKHGFALGKMAARAVALSSRNVITAPPMSQVDSPNSPQAFNVNEICLPLFMAMKSSMPFMVNKLKDIFFNQIFLDNGDSISAIDPDTNELTYIELTWNEVNKFTTSDGINKLIDEFRNNHNHFKPVTVRGKAKNVPGAKEKDYYLYLIHDAQTDELYCFRSRFDFIAYSQKRHIPKPDTAYLEKLKLLPLDKTKYVVGDTGASALLVGAEFAVYPNTVLLTKDEATAKELQAELDAIEVDETDENQAVIKFADTVVIRVADDYEQEHLDNSIDVEGYRVLPIEAVRGVLANAKAKHKKLVKFLEANILDTSLIRPMTWAELFYIACFVALYGKYTTATRHPVLVLSNITLNKIKVMSTNTSRIVEMKFLNADRSSGVVFPHYPVMSSSIKGSMSVFPAHLEKYDGDHDGDVLGIHILFSEQATDEIKQYFDSPTSMVDASHTLEYGTGSGRLCRFTMMAATYRELPEYKPNK